MPRVDNVRKKCGSCCHVSPMSAKNAEAVATCHRCPQKMRKLLPRVNDVRKKCGSCCHMSPMCAKNATIVAMCQRLPQKMRRQSTGVDDVRNYSAAIFMTAFLKIPFSDMQGACASLGKNITNISEWQVRYDSGDSLS